MARMLGTNGADSLFGWNQTDLLTRGKRGDDDIAGSQFSDRLYGDKGADYLCGHDGSDKLYGGADGDILDERAGPNGLAYDYDELWGGRGDDHIFGGVGGDKVVGGLGNDYIEVLGGAAYGDETAGVPRRAVGADVIVSDLSLDFGNERIWDGGLGSDTFQVTFSPGDPATAVNVLAFQPGQDQIVLWSYIPWEGGRLAFHQELTSFLDSNKDGRLGAGDDMVRVGEDSVTIDFVGDTLTLHGATDFVL